MSDITKFGFIEMVPVIAILAYIAGSLERIGNALTRIADMMQGKEPKP